MPMEKQKKAPPKKEEPNREVFQNVRSKAPEQPASGGKPKFTESIVRNLSAKDYEANRADIAEAMKSPDFYDMSSSAR